MITRMVFAFFNSYMPLGHVYNELVVICTTEQAKKNQNTKAEFISRYLLTIMGYI